MLKNYLTEAERTKLREEVTATLIRGGGESRYEIAVMNVVLRLLDTVDMFSRANYKLCKQVTDFELAAEQNKEILDDLYRTLDSRYKENLELIGKLRESNDTARDLFLEKVGQEQILEQVMAKVDTLTARVTKKKLKKTTLKKKK